MAKSIKDEILEIVSMVTEKDAKDIPPDAHLVQEVGADSMMALEILAALEKKYKIIIPEDMLKEMTTVNKITHMTQEAMKMKR